MDKDVLNSEEKEQKENNFHGDFHERDSLEENNIVDEVQQSFLDYSMSVIASRALPDLRDGLKPVHGQCTRKIILQISHIRRVLLRLDTLWDIIIHMVIVLYMRLW